MNWTNDKPTIEGWYFWRKNSSIGDVLHWDVIYIEIDMLFKLSGQWAGPIQEPE